HFPVRLRPERTEAAICDAIRCRAGRSGLRRSWPRLALPSGSMNLWSATATPCLGTDPSSGVKVSLSKRKDSACRLWQFARAAQDEDADGPAVKRRVDP